jgi:2,4-dienoyl-CoA reductase-like NADH-dependent reductase (Old Yellow Enzyme family)
VSAQAQGYAGTPCCYTDKQVQGWIKVTDAVHAKGGTIVVQLWHTDRVSHTSFQNGQLPVGPSAIRANTMTFIAEQGFVDVSMPRAEFRAAQKKILPHLVTEIVKCSDHAKGFEVIPRRWVVERTFAGLEDAAGWPRILKI